MALSWQASGNVNAEATLALIDTHCHLDLAQFDADRDAVLARAAAAGVRTIINPAIDLAACRRILALSEQQVGIYAAVGVHPNDCADFGGATANELRELARHPNVVAIGEIGLDYYWEKVGHEQQKQALRAQLALAAELALPVILHCRNAEDGGTACATDLLWELEQWWPEIRKRRGEDAIFGVWHAFGGTLSQAQRAYDLGLVLGLGGPVTYQNAQRLQALAPQLRGDRMLLETDAPYLTPHPYRGQRNEPAYLPLIAGRLAQLFDTSVANIAVRTATTARQCFGNSISALAPPTP
jgi:TatD DNase family protein